jgi:hypothetical protein
MMTDESDGDGCDVNLEPSPRHDLIGRNDEITRLANMLRDPHVVERSVLLVGEPGIGKTSLLTHAATVARASGMRVLTTTGVESESQVPFAGLQDLLRPVAHHTDQILDRYRDALESAFGLSDARVPDAFLAGLAALDLLAAAAVATKPVLLVLDDVQWIDRATLDALTVVGRRLGDDPIWLVAACRDNYRGPIRDAGIVELSIPRLDESASHDLLHRCLPGSAASVRDRILEVSAGNPLALVELSRGVDVFLGEATAMSRRLERAFAGRLGELSPPALAVVLVASMNDGDTSKKRLTPHVWSPRSP